MTSFRILDPFIGFNELACEWVADKSWTYKVNFPSPTAEGGATTALAFDGLDTYATVKLNGKVLLETDNQHLSYRSIITSHLNKEGENELEIDFASARLKALEIKKQHPDHKWLCWNGDVSRLASRKAQYHWSVDAPFRPPLHLTILQGLGLGPSFKHMWSMACCALRDICNSD